MELERAVGAGVSELHLGASPSASYGGHVLYLYMYSYFISLLFISHIERQEKKLLFFERVI